MGESNIVRMYKQGYSIKDIVDKEVTFYNSTKAKAKANVQHEIYAYLMEKNKENPPAETSGQDI